MQNIPPTGGGRPGEYRTFGPGMARRAYAHSIAFVLPESFEDGQCWRTGEGVTSFELRLAEGAMDDLGHAIDRLLSEIPPSHGTDEVAGLLVAVSTAVRSLPLRCDTGNREAANAVARKVLTEMAALCATTVARMLRHAVLIDEPALAALGEVLASGDGRRLELFFRALLGLPGAGFPGHWAGAAVRPRAFLAPPLSRLTMPQWEAVMARSMRLSSELTRQGYVVIIPDRRLSPDTCADLLDNLLDEMADAERYYIATADLLVAVDAEPDSWGVSRSVAWAEATGAPVIVACSDYLWSCRVLQASAYRTRNVEKLGDEESLVATVAMAARAQREVVEHRQADRCRQQTAVERLLQHARSRLDRLDPAAFNSALMTPARAKEILRCAALADTVSQPERRALRRLLSDVGVGGLLDALDDRAASRTSPSPPLGSQLKRSIDLTSWENLQSAASVRGWDNATCHRLMQAFLDPVVPAAHAHSGRAVDGEDWLALYDRLFGTAG